MKKVLLVVGTRPNIIKITQFPAIFQKYGGAMDLKIVHTGQHHDHKMSTVFFEQFGLHPDKYLAIEQGSPNFQIAQIITAMEKAILEYKPDVVMVPGDVNSTLAAALAANKCGVKVAHLESGLRSFDRAMPEEFNRILTDDIADFFFVTEESGRTHLLQEGKPAEKIHFVGNTMIDTLVAFSDKIDSATIMDRLEVTEKSYVLMTMHRPSNVDEEAGLSRLIAVIGEISRHCKIVFPAHPRTLKKLKEFGLLDRMAHSENLLLTDPLDYFSFQKLIKMSRAIITDSGGVQEESTFYGVPCLTLRPNTERPVTVTTGTNELLPMDPAEVLKKMNGISSGTYKKGTIPPCWDGKATERVTEVLSKFL